MEKRRYEDIAWKLIIAFISGVGLTLGYKFALWVLWLMVKFLEL